MKVIVTNQTDAILPTSKVLKKIAKFILKEQNQPRYKISVGVFYVDEKRIHEINKEYRNKDKPTDVISFRMIDNPEFLKLNKKNFPLDYDKGNKTIYLGEIFICESVAKEQAKEWKHSQYREVVELFCHGMLHLLGYDHEEEEDLKTMREHEQIICENLDRLLKRAD